MAYVTDVAEAWRRMKIKDLNINELNYLINESNELLNILGSISSKIPLTSTTSYIISIQLFDL